MTPPITPAITGSTDEDGVGLVNNGVEDAVVADNDNSIDVVVGGEVAVGGQIGHIQVSDDDDDVVVVVVVVVVGAIVVTTKLETVDATVAVVDVVVRCGVGDGVGAGDGVGKGVGRGVGGVGVVLGKTKICNERRVKPRMLPACVASELLPGWFPIVPLVDEVGPFVKPQ
jgi:hypothetical protein